MWIGARITVVVIRDLSISLRALVRVHHCHVVGAHSMLMIASSHGMRWTVPHSGKETPAAAGFYLHSLGCTHLKNWPKRSGLLLAEKPGHRSPT